MEFMGFSTFFSTVNVDNYVDCVDKPPLSPPNYYEIMNARAFIFFGFFWRGA